MATKKILLDNSKFSSSCFIDGNNFEDDIDVINQYIIKAYGEKAIKVKEEFYPDLKMLYYNTPYNIKETDIIKLYQKYGYFGIKDMLGVLKSIDKIKKSVFDYYFTSNMDNKKLEIILTIPQIEFLGLLGWDLDRLILEDLILIKTPEGCVRISDKKEEV